MSGWREKLVIGTNMKMYMTVRQTIVYLKELEGLTCDLAQEGLHLFTLIPAVSLYPAMKEVDPDLIHIGAQNMCWEDAGQFTGEISPVMLAEFGITLIMAGHSERRQIFGETDEIVNKKVQAGIRHGFTNLICVGETLQEKELGIGKEQIRKQIKQAFHGVAEDQVPLIWLAYEPVWAIGIGSTPASPEYANEIHAVIRSLLTELYPNRGSEIPLLYGGSVNTENATGLIEQAEVDGLFIGRAAWDPQRFTNIIRSVLPIWQRKIN